MSMPRVFNVRPHPCPLPLERGKCSPRVEARNQSGLVRTRKAVLKRPHSKRFAHHRGHPWSRQRLECARLQRRFGAGVNGESERHN